MNKKFVILILFFIPLVCVSQITDVQKLSSLCKVWGFLKYYHPGVTTGRLDWDKELIEKQELLKWADNKNEINKIYTDWFNSLGQVKQCKHYNNDLSNNLNYNLDFRWLADTSIFDAAIISRLNFIKENRSRRQGYYIRNQHAPSPDYSNEKSYPEMLYPTEGYRLLGLFRYWNIVEYFYPYKYAIGEDWDDVLSDMIPKFQHCTDTISYNLSIAELTARLNDSHADFNSVYKSQFFGNYFPACKVKIIGNKAVVTGFWSDSLAKVNDFQLGDVIVKFNDHVVTGLISEKEKFIGASNQAAKHRNLAMKLLNSNIDTAWITVDRNGKYVNKDINLYHFKDFHYNWNSQIPKVYKYIGESIGYINM